MNPVTQQPNSVYDIPGEGPGPITIRIMTPDDGDFAADMTVEAFRSKMEWAIGKSNIEPFKRSHGRDLRNGNSQYYERNLIALYNGERAGLCTFKCRKDKEIDVEIHGLGCCSICRLACMDCALSENPPANAVYVDHICVDDRFRGKGIGKVLLDRADYEAKKRGKNMIYLAVTQTNRAKNLYERHGYRVTGDIDGCCISWCGVGVRKFYKMEKSL